MGERWCTVTVIEESGRRHSVDVLASSTFDAAHIFVTHAKADLVCLRQRPDEAEENNGSDAYDKMCSVYGK